MEVSVIKPSLAKELLYFVAATLQRNRNVSYVSVVLRNVVQDLGRRHLSKYTSRPSCTL